MEHEVRKDSGRPISIHFHPLEFEKKSHAVEKTDGGVKRKYLYGVSSGLKVDGHGERMTDDCIKSMMAQGRSGNLLLYAGLHGVNFNDDLGILAESDISSKGDWITGYRLYDEYDKDTVGDKAVQEAQKLWAKVQGLPPYGKPAQKGFSIEGFVPAHQIISKKVNEDGSYSQRVMNEMILDGVVVVNRPAYQDSVITAVYKCLQEYQPQSLKHIQTKYASLLSESIKQKEEERNFYQTFFEINSTLEDKISDIMKIPMDSLDGRLKQRLDILFDEYKTLMVGLVLQNADIFKDDTIIINSDQGQPIDSIAEKQEKIMKQLATASRQFSNLITKRLGGNNAR